MSGCSKVSQGCKHCYAERLWPKVAGAEAKRTGQPPRAFTDVRCHPERLDAPLHWRTPRRIFVNSMSDLFHEDVPFQFIDEVWGTMIEAPQHQYQILTKRPARMREYVTRYAWAGDTRITAWPLPHVWLGVSVEDQDTAIERITLLLQTLAAVRLVSYEPALGPVQLASSWIFDIAPRIDWLIAGGESGPNARPAHPDWFRSVRDQCANAGVAFFFKQWGEWAPTEIHPGGPMPKMARRGKKAAGRLLDGRTHDEYPA